MGLVDKLKGKPTAADLDGQIVALERTVAELADEHEQAEWAEFLRQTILNRRLIHLDRARLRELRAEFEAESRAKDGESAATSSSA